MNETTCLAKWVYELDDEALTPERLTDIRYKLLDWFGCALGMAKSDTAKKLCRTFAAERGCGSSTVFCDREDYPLFAAAFLNGAESHILECDDVHKSAITHPGIIAVTSALMVSESYGKTLREFALGAVAGYEIMIRMGNALNPSHYDYWHTTGTCGTFAAAAAAGKVLGLTLEEMENAFGIAATMAAGLTCVFGTDGKLVTVGNAVRNGIQSALLAWQGLESCHDVLERPFGYAEAVSRAPRFSALTETNGYQIDTAYYKMYASCAHTHSALDALFALREEYPFEATEVEKIEVRAYTKAAELTGTYKDQSPSAAKFSLPFCIAAAVLYGAVSVQQFEPEVLCSEEIRSFAQKVTVRAESTLDAEYPVKRPETVEIYLKNGEILERTVQLPNGKPKYSFIEEKFHILAARSVDKSRADAMQEAILSLQMDRSIRELNQQLKGWIYIG